MHNQNVERLRTTFITFFVLGGVALLLGIIGFASSANDPYGSTAGAVVWISAGSGLISFALLAMLFYFVAASIDYRQTHPYVKPVETAKPAASKSDSSKRAPTPPGAVGPY